MSSSDWVVIAMGVVNIFLVIIGWLITRQIDGIKEEIKDLKTAINELWKARQDDVAAHRDLREIVAGRHYERDELDAKFDKLEGTFKDGFKDMGAKFDRMADALMTHLAKTDDRTGKFERKDQ